TGALQWMFGIKPAIAAGMFAGSFTNTPALAGVLDYIKAHAPEALRDQLLAEPVVGYSITYPMGVVGMILAIYAAQRLWKIDYAAEARELGVGGNAFQNRTIRVLRPEATHETLQSLIARFDWDVVFGRLKRAN